MALPKPDYLSRDFAGLKDSLLQFTARSFPEWQPASEGDFGMVFMEMFAYVGDVLSYYTDRAQFENYLGTATQRDSVLGLAYLLGYVPNSGTPAQGTVNLVTATNSPEVTIPAGTQLSTGRIPALDGPVVFEVNEDTVLAASGEANSPIPVTEGVSQSYVKIGTSNGQPSQTFALPHAGVYRSTVRIFVEDAFGSTEFMAGVTTVRAREWVMADHLLSADNDDPAFETQFQDKAFLINFGDDINGAIPSTGLQVFASYRYGEGANGNVPAGQVRLINERSLAGVHVDTDSNGVYLSSTMTGGTDPESTESIRHNAPRAYRTQGRIVTEQDFKDAALGVEGVTKANSVIGTYTSVTLYVAGADGLEPSETLKQVVYDQLSSRLLGGVSLTVASPDLVPVNFGSEASPISVELYPQYSQRTARTATRRVIRSVIANLAFGERLSVGKIYDAISSVDGVKYVTIPVMARDDAAQTGTATITPRAWEIFTVNDINLDIEGGVA